MLKTMPAAFLAPALRPCAKGYRVVAGIGKSMGGVDAIQAAGALASSRSAQ
jgi:hypothetical protein